MKSFLKTKDFAVSGEEFELMLDMELNMLRTYPEPENLDSYYNSETYISHTDSADNFVGKLYQYIKKYNLKRKVSLINKYTDTNKTLLDIGAGTGSFLEEQAEKLGINIKKEFGDLALSAKTPANLGERCTVFTELSLVKRLETWRRRKG